MTLAWITPRLRMGTKTRPMQLLYWHDRTKKQRRGVSLPS